MSYRTDLVVGKQQSRPQQKAPTLPRVKWNIWAFVRSVRDNAVQIYHRATLNLKMIIKKMKKTRPFQIDEFARSRFAELRDCVAICWNSLLWIVSHYLRFMIHV